MIAQPSSSSMRWIVTAAGGAPAVITPTPFGASAFTSAGAFASMISTVGAAHSRVTFSSRGDLEHGRAVELRQADVLRARGRHGPRERPAVGVEHRQRPQVDVGRRHRRVRQHADAVHPRVAMRDHHALRPRRRAAGVVDGQQIALADRRARETTARVHRRALRSRASSAGPRSVQARPSSATKCTNVFQIRANRIDRGDVIGAGAHHLRAAVLNQVAEIVGDQPEVDRHEHGADLRNRVERLELRVRVGRDVGDAIALLDAEALQRRRPAIAAIEELAVGPALRAVNDAFAVARTACRARRMNSSGVSGTSMRAELYE